MAEIPSAVDVARRLADALEREGVSYAIGGAIALGYFAAPRATIDVDINVFLPPARALRRTLDVLAQAGFASDADEETLRGQALQDGQFRGSIDGMRVDVFVPAIPFYAQLESRRRRIQLLGRPAWVLGPEDLAILKMMFFRRKDLADVEALARDLGPDLDVTFVRRTLIDLVGAEDERVVSFEQIVDDVEATPSDS